jgi:hypothetical protein
MFLFANNKDSFIILNKYILEIIKFDSYLIYILEIE